MYEITDKELGMVWRVLHNEFKEVMLYNPNDKEDFFQVGCVGLVKASNNYEECKGAKFSTYAYMVIRRELSFYFNRSYFKKRVDSVSMSNEIFGTSDKDFSESLGYEHDYTNIYASDLLKDLRENLSDVDFAIIKKRAEGKTQLEISKAVGLAQSNVNKRLKGIEHYVFTGDDSKLVKGSTESRRSGKKDKYIKLYEQGLSYCEISNKVGVKQKTVESFLRRCDVVTALPLTSQMELGKLISIDVLDKGLSFEVVAMKYDTNIHSAKRYFNKYGEVS